MSKSKKAKPSFFKVLMGDFSNNMSVPPAFTKRFDGRSLIGKSVTIRSPTGEDWVVTVEENGNRLVFAGGWQEFVKDHSLETGDFLVFKYHDKSKFKVKIFDKSCCQRLIHLPNSGRVKSENGETDDEESSTLADKRARTGDKENPKTKLVSEFKSENPCFITTLTKFKVDQLTIPKDLAVEKGLMKKKWVMLNDPSGKPWTVKLRIRPDGRLDMKDGWVKFLRENKVAIGNTLIFEFIQPNLMQVHVFRHEKTVYNRIRILEAATGLKN